MAQTRRRAASSTSTINSFAVMPLAKVTIRASPSIFTSVTKSGASRVWIAPTSRTASHTFPGSARRFISRRIEAMSRLGTAIGLDAVSVRIDREGRVVVRPIVGAQAGLAIVLAAGTERARVKRRDALARRRIEAEVQAGRGVGRDRLVAGRNPQRDRILAVAERGVAGAEAGVAERIQCRVVEPLGAGDIAHADRNMIEHVVSPSL